jgi:hypothetical protein
LALPKIGGVHVDEKLQVARIEKKEVLVSNWVDYRTNVHLVGHVKVLVEPMLNVFTPVQRIPSGVGRSSRILQK